MKTIVLTVITVIITASITLNIIGAVTFLPSPSNNAPRDFNNIIELKAFLALNTIDQNEYIEGIYDCNQFSQDLVDDARRCGYRMYCYSDMDWGTKLFPIINGKEMAYKNDIIFHMMCCAYVDGEFVVIEPQTDEIWNVKNEIQ